MITEVIEQHRAFFNVPHRAVQTVFDVFGDGHQKALGGKGVSRMTAKAH